jgi:hypothetical protein
MEILCELALAEPKEIKTKTTPTNSIKMPIFVSMLVMINEMGETSNAHFSH